MAEFSLTHKQRSTLHVLAYLFVRMGWFDRAGRIYSALQALPPATGVDREAETGLAIIALHNGEEWADRHAVSSKVLEHVRRAMDGMTLSPGKAALHLIRAQALWQDGRQDEARTAVDDYLHLAEGKTS